MNNLEQKLLGSMVSIGREHWDVPVRIELRAYLEFTRRINLQLRRMINRWEKKTRAASRHIRRFNRVPQNYGKNEY